MPGFFRKIRGPRLGTKLAIMGLALLIIPWFSYRQLVEMERLLIQGQSQAQLLTAEGISTLFNGREDLFNDMPVNLDDFEPLYAQPLENTIRLDGQVDDWGEEAQGEYLSFGSPTGGQDADFSLILGERADFLYVHMRIRDDILIHRDSDYLRLDNADHIRLNFVSSDGENGRLAIIFEQSGVVTGYAMDEQWRYAAVGAAENRVQGVLLRSAGKDVTEVELRIPLALLGSRRFFGLTFIDVDDAVARTIDRSTQTLPKNNKQSFNLVVLRTPEVRNIVKGLGYAGARILVIDDMQRVRAEVGDIRQDIDAPVSSGLLTELSQVFEAMRPWIHELVMREPIEAGGDQETEGMTPSERALRVSLTGEPIALRNPLSENAEIILAAHPIVSDESVIGTVIVEQNIDDILRFQRSAMEQVLALSVLSLLAIFTALLAFAGRLAWRIRNLRREASAAIDARGRLKKARLSNEMEAGDEIGDLARSVSGMLEKLKQHNAFLESMPRTLRHEINNPLNTLSTSLQNLAQEHPQIDQSKYLDSAQRGVHRIGSIVQNLADAANLEESLEAEELEPIDLNELLSSYVANCSFSQRGVQFKYRGTPSSAYAEVSDFRIEQMMDKVIDNAVDFHRTHTPIRVQLDRLDDFLQISVANRGPVLAPELLKTIFDSMVSHRGQQNRLHFGLGLHVVRIIAEHHGGSVDARNLEDGSGVAFLIQLPAAYSATQEAAPLITEPKAVKA
tara:strand:+ start:7634 stop:9832 length:2199 start_codon:yes stop_codon:yes gene_type:complete